MKIYVASSWRNQIQPDVITKLKCAGYDVYDFRNPTDGDNGFHWSEIDVYWQEWDVEHYRANLHHPIAKKGFKKDFDAMKWADVGVMVMPCGRSAHLEAGYFVGAEKPLIIFIPEKNEPELMYSMADYICKDLNELMNALKSLFNARS